MLRFGTVLGRERGLAAFVILCAVVLALAGCGRKAQPEFPEGSDYPGAYPYYPEDAEAVNRRFETLFSREASGQGESERFGLRLDRSGDTGFKPAPFQPLQPAAPPAR